MSDAIDLDRDTATFVGAFGYDVPEAVDAAVVHGFAAVDPLAAVERAFPDLTDLVGFDPLADAMARYCLAVPFTWIEALDGLGVSRPVIARLSARASWGRCRAIERDGRWEEQRDGLPRLIVPVWEHGWVTDLVALNSAARGSWSLLRGDAVMLGYQEYYWSHFDDRSTLRLFGTPLDWLEGECRGICVLRWGREALGLLRSLGPGVTLLADNAAAAAKLAELLRWGGLPKVGAV